MDLIPLTTLNKILSFLPYHEVRPLIILSRQFWKATQQLFPIKGPSLSFIQACVDDFNVDTYFCKQKLETRFNKTLEIAGCEVMEIECLEGYLDVQVRWKKLPANEREHSHYSQAALHVCRLKASMKKHPQGIIAWGSKPHEVGNLVRVSVKGYWSERQPSFPKEFDGKIIEVQGDSVLIETIPFEYKKEAAFEFLLPVEFEKYQNKSWDIEGVLYLDGVVGEKLRNSLISNINQLASRQTPDYHPGSGDIVRDFLHPALYCFVRGVSEFIPSADLPELPANVAGQMKDQWGRKYETSLFQWLPTYIDFDQWGNCRYRNHIVNFPRTSENESLYQDLERLFRLCIPHFEQVLGYGQFLTPASVNEDTQFCKDEDEEDELYDLTDVSFPDEPPAKYPLVGKSLQVITKIVDYELQPGQSYEGVWHVEGMSHENIVATADFILDRDENISGGDVLFKRALLRGEAGYLFNTGQSRISSLENIVQDGLVPLGRVSTPKERLIIFPNSHVHQVTKMENHGTKLARRRIVVFFLVNPEVRIVSTQEVPHQVETISKADAFKYRLELMEERKFHKQDWNVRDISLCEH